MKASQRERPRGRPRARAKKTGQPHPRPPPLTPDQAQAADQIRAWLAQGEQAVVLGGYAGTGKTFTVTALLEGLPEPASPRGDGADPQSGSRPARDGPAGEPAGAALRHDP